MKTKKSKKSKKVKNRSGGGQYELDDNALEEAAGGGFQKWVDDAWNKINNG